MLENYLVSSFSLGGDTSNNAVRSVPSSLDEFFKERYLENTLPIYIDKSKILIIGIYCMNLDKLYVYPKLPPKLYIDIRFWGINPLGEIFPLKQGVMIPFKAIKEIIPRLFGLQNKYESCLTLDLIKTIFDPTNFEV